MKSSPLIMANRTIDVSLPGEPHGFGRAAVRMRVHVGRPVPRVRLHAIIQGAYTIVDQAAVIDRWLALCFVSGMGEAEVGCLNRQAGSFARAGAVLLAVAPEGAFLNSAYYRECQALMVPLLTDPLNRLRRTYGIPRRPLSVKAKTFLIDPGRILRHHIVHDLNMWSMDSVRGLMSCSQFDVSRESAGRIEEGTGYVVRAS